MTATLDDVAKKKLAEESAEQHRAQAGADGAGAGPLPDRPNGLL